MEMHEGYKKRLLFINGHLTAGGTEKCLVDVLRNIDFGKFQVDLLLVEGLGDYAAQLPSQVNVIYQNISHAYGPLVQTILHCIKTMNWRCLSIRVLLLLGKVFKHRIFHPMAHLLLGRRKYDYVIAARGGICADIASYGKISDKKYLWWHHGDLGLSSHDVVEQSLSNFSKIIAVSNTISRFLTNEFPQLSNRIVVVENGVDIDTVSKFGMLMNPYQNEKDTYIICSVGRINPEKRYELAVLSAKKLLLRGITDFKWYIVGDGIDFSSFFINQSQRNRRPCDYDRGQSESVSIYSKCKSFCAYLVC